MAQPDPIYWNIDEPKKFRKTLEKLPQPVQLLYLEKINHMIHSKYPVGANDKWERTRYGLAWVARLNDYYRFSYIFFPKQAVITLIRIGSHKQIGTEK